MAFNSNGQVSYLVLDSLADGSKYGLEIIEYISKKTGGTYIMKKPTLYSCLTRMEKKGQVSSSFWGESDLGGKRHYYTITDLGRKSLEDLSTEFANVDFQEEAQPEEQQSSPVILQQDNLFDLVQKEDKKPAPQQPKEENPSGAIENQIDMFSLPEQEEEQSQEKMQYYQTILEQDVHKDDGKLLPAEEKNVTLSKEEEEQNQRLSDELKKIRKKKSFSENQIEMSVVYESEEDQETERRHIEELKRSLLATRTNNISEQQPEEPKTTTQDFASQEEEINEEALPETKDDAVFITNPRIEESDIPIQRKIAPPNIEVNVYDDNLPAPKRNSNIEPTYKDMMAKLFEKKKETKKEQPKPQPEQQAPSFTSENYSDVDSFVDYGTLKKYFSGHGIEFKEYKKSVVERNHNTNFLNVIASVFLLLLSGISSAILYGIVSACNALQASSTFLYYTVPILFAVYCIYTLVRYFVEPSKKANLRFSALFTWAAFVLCVVVIVVIDVICGMEFETMKAFLTPILVPIFAVAIAIPVHYYTKKFLYNRYSK